MTYELKLIRGYILLNNQYQLYTKKEMAYMSGSDIELDVLAYEGFQFSHWELNGIG